LALVPQAKYDKANIATAQKAKQPATMAKVTNSRGQDPARGAKLSRPEYLASSRNAIFGSLRDTIR